MKIGIDLVNLRSVDEGIGRYARQVIASIATIDKIEKCTLFMTEIVSNQIQVENPKFQKQIVEIRRRKYIPANQIYFALGRNINGLDLLHSPVSVSPLLCRAKTVVTIHDLAYIHFPHYYSRTAVMYWRLAYRIACAKADLVLADSDSTKQDLIRFMRTPDRKISVLYPYVDSVGDLSSKDAIKDIKVHYSLPDKFILHVGVPHARKNLSTLVKAFKLAKQEGNFPHKLVLAGPAKGWSFNSLSEEINSSRMQDEVVFPGYIEDSDLPALYRAAEALVYPSMYEGFGYPPLEAMAHGTPVIVSNISSIPEVVGDAGLYANPLDYRTFADQIARLLSEPGLAEELREKSIIRARGFSLKRMAEGLSSAYEHVLST